MKMRITIQQIILLCLLAMSGANSLALPWPVQQQDNNYTIGNSYGEYQYYGGSPYLHPGIDILAPAGTPVYAVEAGYVKAVLTTSAALHWRVAVGDSAGASECDGWMYAHLAELSIMVNVGDWVEQGQYLGELVQWPVADFHHLHFVKIRHSGESWDSNWEFIGNPLDELDLISDTLAPSFEPAIDGQKFTFCANETSDYFGVGSPVFGNVDIISRISDHINHLDWQLAAHKIEYKIEGESSIPWTNSVIFTGESDYANNVNVIYKKDGTSDTRGDYSDRQFYHILTNTDGDSLIESSDAAYSWQTANFHNGDYTVYARAYDRAGNVTLDSMDVSVANYFTLQGLVTFPDGNPQFENVDISIMPEAISGASDESAKFSIGAVGGGWQTISFNREGYQTVDTSILINENLSIEVAMLPMIFAEGDANFDGGVNVGDVVHIINFIFKHGSVPKPYYAGDVNGDGLVGVGDAVYLINYIFKGGPAPVDLSDKA